MMSSIKEREGEIISHAIKHFAEVSSSPEFLDFSSELLHRIISADDLNIDQELDVFQAVLRWYEHAKEYRQSQLVLLIASIRLVQFAPTYITKYVKPLFGCEKIAEEALKWISEPIQGDSHNLPGFTKSRNKRKCFLLILNDVKKLKYILRYNQTLHKWEKCYELKFIDYSYGLIYYEDSLYFFGGRSRGLHRNNNVKRFDLNTFKWLEMAKMSQRRDDLCVALLNEKIYAFGGHNGGDPFNTVEVYNIRDNNWKSLPEMSDYRYGASAVVFEEKVYIFGGLSIECQPLASVECYDPIANTWKKYANMHEARGWPGVTILDGFIYILGGFNEGMMCTAERFDPKQNTWEKISSLNVARFGICAITTVENRIWAIGGHDVYTVEEYDCANDKWIEKMPLPVYCLHSYVEVPNNLVDKLQTKYLCK